MGCFGCGCLILIVILLVLVGLVGGIGYFSYKQVLAISSSAPATFPPYNGSDDIYTGAQKKIDAFNQAVGTGNFASLTLSADEINAMIAHDPDLAKVQARLLVTLTGDEARLQGSIPTDSVWLLNKEIPGRYLNIDTTFAITFNNDTKMVGLDLHEAELGDTPIPPNALPTLQAELMPSLNTFLRKFPASRNALAAAKTVTIKDGQFVIETK
jgi:hypothetical protein